MKRLQSLKSIAVLACVTLALAALAASVDATKDDKDKPALSGVWELKGGEPKIEFADKEVLKISPHGKDEVILILCHYTVAKGGLVKAKITDHEGKEQAKEKAKELLPVGLEFSFKWQVKDDIATLEDIKGDKVDVMKAHLEGKYEKK